MKKILFIFIITLLYQDIFAQQSTFAPEGAEWYYNYEFYTAGGNTAMWRSYVKLTHVGMQEINEINCYVLEEYYHRTNDYQINDEVTLRYIFIDDEQIYEVEEGIKYLLYDFSKQVGEYWILPKYNDTVFVIGNEEILLTNGENCTALHVSSSARETWRFPSVISNRFGGGLENGYFFPTPALLGANFIDGLNCYMENGEIVHKYSTNDCNREVLGVFDDPEKSSIQISNPITDELILIFNVPADQIKSVTIFNRLARKVYGTKTVNGQVLRVPFANYASGVYAISVEYHDRKKEAYKIVKQ